MRNPKTNRFQNIKKKKKKRVIPSGIYFKGGSQQNV
jgi:hypothetical protein